MCTKHLRQISMGTLFQTEADREHHGHCRILPYIAVLRVQPIELLEVSPHGTAEYKD